MMDIPIPLDNLTGYGALIVVAVMVITRKLVWHADLAKAEARADRWEGIALQALSTAEKLTVQAEVTNSYLKKIPDPAKEGASE